MNLVYICIMIKFDVNTGNLVILSSKLERLNKSALPVSIRGTLNKAAFDLKTNTMPLSAKKNFVNRSSNFFKANSTVDKATGFNINSMKAETGFINSKLKGGNNYAVKDLEKQEQGGTIGGKSFIPINAARSGGSKNKLVSPRYRLNAIKNIVDSRKSKGKTKGQRFVQAAKFAGKGGFVLGEYKDKLILWRINSLNRTKNGKMKLTALYSYQENRTIHVNSSNFMKEATQKTESKMPQFYNEEAIRQFDKVIK